MKRIFIIVLLISFILTSCKNNDSDDSVTDWSLFEKETLEVFDDIDFSSYTITSIEKLLYYNGEADYEYESLTSIDDGFMINIIEMSNQFSDHKFSVGSMGIPIGGAPILSLYLEKGEESIHVQILGGYLQGEYSAVIFSYRNSEEEYFISYCYAYSTEIENLYNLANK